MRQDTRRNIHEILKIIGQNGLSGVSFETTSLQKAINSLPTVKPLTLATKRRLVAELRRQELVTYQKNDGSISIQLTVKGIHRLQQSEIEILEIPKPNTWDHRWRMVTFDIPARRSESRYILTSQLRRLGFSVVQHSVWIHPYPCFDIVQKIVQYANLQPFVFVAEISRLDEVTLKKLQNKFSNL